VRGESRADISEYLWRELEDHFGLDPAVAGTEVFADRILAWFAAKG
jgi:hypothetical protein